MRRSVLALAALLAFALPLAPLAAEPAQSGAGGGDPMANWRPPKVKNEKQDRAEISKLFKTMEAAGKKGDVEAAASLIDFPVLMLTDDSKGEAHGGAWTREQWLKEMGPLYKPMPDMKVSEKPTVFLMTDSLATVTNVATITMGKNKPFTTRNSMLLARVGGEWKVKAMVEGGWGDAMAGAGHEGTAGATPSSAPSDTTSSGTSAGTPTSPGMTSGTSPGTSSSGTSTSPGSTPAAPPDTSTKMPPPTPTEPPATTK
jgi:hypothetical protein